MQTIQTKTPSGKEITLNETGRQFRTPISKEDRYLYLAVAQDGLNYVIAKDQEKAVDEFYAVIAKEKAAIQAKTVTIHLSTRGWGDYSSLEWSGDITRADAEILAECRELLTNGYDVDKPNQTDDELAVKIKAAREKWAGKEEREQKRSEKESAHIKHLIDTGYCFNCESYCHGDCGHYSSDPSIRYKKMLRGAIREQNYGIND